MRDETDSLTNSKPSEPHALDVVPPARIALLVEQVGLKKAKLPLVPTLTLGILAGVEEGVDISPLLLKLLDDFGYTKREDAVFVQCFDDTEIYRLRHELACPLRLVQLIGDNSWLEATTDYDSLRRADGIRKIAESADAIGPHISHLYELEKIDSAPVSTGLTGMAHDNGLLVHPYTFRADDIPAGFASFEELIRYFADDIGIDGLFTDFPDLALKSLGK